MTYCKWQDVGNSKGRHWDGKEYTALEIARENERTENVSLLANPSQTRHEIRVKLGLLDALAVVRLDSFPVR